MKRPYRSDWLNKNLSISVILFPRRTTHQVHIIVTIRHFSFTKLGLPSSESQTSLTSNESKTTTGTENGSTPKLDPPSPQPGRYTVIYLVGYDKSFINRWQIADFLSHSGLKWQEGLDDDRDHDQDYDGEKNKHDDEHDDEGNGETTTPMAKITTTTMTKIMTRRRQR